MYHHKIKLICLLFLFSLSYQALAQIPIIINPMQASSSITWQQIETKHFKIIFPKETIARAQEVANALEYFNPLVTRNLTHDFKKITLVLDSDSTTSNGYVGLTPWRSRWVLSPYIGNRLGGSDWLRVLSIHEQRHMIQISKYKKGSSKVLYYLMGESGQALAMVWSTPHWFFEGDAVVEETLLTEAGRGRNPHFTRHYRAQLLNKTLPGYDKNYLGSYKDYVPSHYPLGYILSSYMRTKLAKDITNETVSYAASSAWNPFAFQRGLRLNSGSDLDAFHEQAFNKFKERFETRDFKIDPSKYEIIDQEEGDFTQNSIPFPYQGKFLVFRSGLANAGHFSLYDPKTKEYDKLFRTNMYSGVKVTIKNDHFVFADQKVHPRFMIKDYSDLFIYDLKNKEKKQITKEARYFIPELSPDSKRIAALTLGKDFSPILHILDLKGTLIKKHHFKSSELPISLNFNSSKTLSYISKNKKEESCLREINLRTGKITTLLKRKNGLLNSLRYEQGIYYFQAALDGQNNIYSFSKRNNRLRKITESRLGATNPVISQGDLIYNEYTIFGDRLVKGSVKQNYPLYTGPGYLIEDIKRKDAYEILEHKKEPTNKKYSAKKLNRKLINIHSWSYLTSFLSPYETLSVRSDDVLAELGLTAGTLYHSGEKSLTYFMGADYQRFWPILHLRGDIGKRTIYLNYNKPNEQTFSWHQNSAEVGFSLPWNNISNGNKLSTTFTAMTGYRYISNKDYINDESNGELTTNALALDFSFHGEQSIRDIKPRYGVDIILNNQITDTKVGSTPNSHLKSYQAVVYAPSFFKHHHFYTSYSYQNKSIDSYDLPDIISFARGYSNGSYRRNKKVTFNYTFPILYPDMALGSWLYLKRLRGNLFFDTTTVDEKEDFRSYGLELTFDSNFLRNKFINLSWGVRYSHLLDNASSKEDNTEFFLENVLAQF